MHISLINFYLIVKICLELVGNGSIFKDSSVSTFHLIIKYTSLKRYQRVLQFERKMNFRKKMKMKNEDEKMNFLSIGAVTFIFGTQNL